MKMTMLRMMGLALAAGLLALGWLASCAVPPRQSAPQAGPASSPEPVGAAPTAVPAAGETRTAAAPMEAPTSAPPTPTIQSDGDPPMRSLIVDIPVVAPSADPAAAPKILRYEQQRVWPGEEFVIDPAALGPQVGAAVGALKLRLLEVGEGQVRAAVVADERMDGNFYPRDPLETVELSGGTCIVGFPLVMDVIYNYCFEVIVTGGETHLRYTLEEESTMPPP